MRIAVLSDVHGNYAALDAVLADIARRGTDLTIGLGDFLSGPFDPKSVADRLMDMDLPAVRGNHDRWVVEGRDKDWVVDALVRDMIAPAQRDWLAALPLNRVIADEVFMCHGTPVDDTGYWMDGFTATGDLVTISREQIEAAAAGIGFPVMVCGHTHVQRNLRLGDGRLLVNPGSVGLPFVLGSPDARYAIIEKRGGDWSVDMIAVPYDRAPAQAQARAFGFPGFATAIATGWARFSDL